MAAYSCALSVVIPTLNESSALEHTLLSLQAARKKGVQLIVVDGGSEDDTCDLAQPLVDILDTAPRGRARQMNHGARLASGESILFLHADTMLPPDVLALLDRWQQSKACWGFFRVALSGSDWRFRVIERFINWRSALFQLPTGDQAIFLKADTFDRLGGFADIAIMEDVEIGKRLRADHGRAYVVPAPVITDSRRWERHGVWKTVWLMWQLRFAYWRGTNPSELARRYQ